MNISNIKIWVCRPFQMFQTLLGGILSLNYGTSILCGHSRLLKVSDSLILCFPTTAFIFPAVLLNNMTHNGHIVFSFLFRWCTFCQQLQLYVYLCDRSQCWAEDLQLRFMMELFVLLVVWIHIVSVLCLFGPSESTVIVWSWCLMHGLSEPLCVALCLTGLTSDLWQTGCHIVTHQIYFLGFMCMDRSVLFVSCLYAGERSPELSHQNPGLDSRSWWERQWQYFQFVQNSNVIYRVHFGLGWDRMWFRLYVKKKSL